VGWSHSGQRKRDWITKDNFHCQFKFHDFSATETTYAGEKSLRGCCKEYFYRKQDKTEQLIERDWLCYSPSQAKLFCFYCKLMTDAEQFGKTGCANWRHITVLISRHESSILTRMPLSPFGCGSAFKNGLMPRWPNKSLHSRTTGIPCLSVLVRWFVFCPKGDLPFDGPGASAKYCHGPS